MSNSSIELHFGLQFSLQPHGWCGFQTICLKLNNRHSTETPTVTQWYRGSLQCFRMIINWNLKMSPIGLSQRKLNVTYSFSISAKIALNSIELVLMLEVLLHSCHLFFFHLFCFVPFAGAYIHINAKSFTTSRYSEIIYCIWNRIRNFELQMLHTTENGWDKRNILVYLQIRIEMKIESENKEEKKQTVNRNKGKNGNRIQRNVIFHLRNY